MKNRKSLLFSIALLLVNTAGAAGALLTVLGIVEAGLQTWLFLGGMLLLCLLSVGFWNTGDKKKTALRRSLFAGSFAVLLLLFRKGFLDGLGWALQSLIEQLNVRYGIHLIWLLPAGAEGSPWQITWSVLAVMALYILLLGFAVVRGNVLTLLAADAVWFAAACVMDEFPAYVWLVLCILGLAGVVIRRAFRDDEGAGVQAVLIGTAVLGAVMVPAYRFALPFLDNRYEDILEARIELNEKLNAKLNEEWIPGIRRIFAGFGSGPGTDVTGNLTRDRGTVYTSAEVYRVTFDAAPQSAVYLRGFVGKDYEGDEWRQDEDAGLEKYYRQKGWELPENGGVLVNLTYEAFRYRMSGKVLVEELSAPGSYSVYPYGARMTEDYEVHWDGTVEREGGSYEFAYSAPEDYHRERGLTGVAAETEERYRSYVYDTFCEYPAEEFPRLTEFLAGAGFRTDSVYDSLKDVMEYLRKNAAYNLDVPNTPRGEDFVEYFLFESREGYCAHFASSAVLMLRYLGVPARYATGYSADPGGFSRNADGTYSAVILDRQAHAWAEVYLDGIGWVPVEMTPGAVAFSADNTAAQLALTGQLTGEETSEGSGPRQFGLSQGASRESEEPESQASQPEGSEGEEPSREEGQQEPTAPMGQEPTAPTEQEPTASTGQDPTAPTGQDPTAPTGQDPMAPTGQEPTAPAEQDPMVSTGQEPMALPEQGEDSGAEATAARQLIDGALAVLLYVLPVVGLLLVSGSLFQAIRKNGVRRLEQAENREKVFLLYRNIRRLLQISGCAERLHSPRGDTAEFVRLLEKCGFGRQEPGAEELQAAWNFCEKLKREVYAGLPFYRKLLFAALDRYGSTGGKAG